MLSFPKSRTSLLGIDSQPTWPFACALSYRFDVLFLITTKSPLVESKFGTKFPKLHDFNMVYKDRFFHPSIISRSLPVQQLTSFIPNVTYSFCFLRIGVRAKGEPPDSAKKGSYVRLVYTLLKGNEKDRYSGWGFGRAIKIACSFLQKKLCPHKSCLCYFCTEMINLGSGNENILSYWQAKSAWKNKEKIKFLDLKWGPLHEVRITII